MDIQDIGNFVAYCLLGVSNYAILLSEWVSVTMEPESTTNSTDFDPMFPDFSGDQGFLQSILLRYFSGPSVVKYGILSNTGP